MQTYENANHIVSHVSYHSIHLQGPKSYNDALAKKFERKKGDMGSSSTGVKDRGIFVAADFRNPRTDQELQARHVCIQPFIHSSMLYLI